MSTWIGSWCARRLVDGVMAMTVLIGSATPAVAHGDLHELLAALDAEIAETPGNPELYLERAGLHRLHQDWTAALADLDRAAALTPALASIAAARARTLHEAGREREAVAAFTTCLTRDAADAQALCGRAYAHRALGEHARAVADFAAVMAAPAPGRSDPQIWLDWADSALRAAGDHAAALAVLERACSQFGDVVSIQEAALREEIAVGRLDAAIARLDRLIAASPRAEGWWLRRGDLLHARGDEALASSAYRRGLACLDRLDDQRRLSAATQAVECTLHVRLAAIAAVSSALQEH